LNLKDKVLEDFHGNAPIIDESLHGKLPTLSKKAAIYISNTLKPGQYFKLAVDGGGCGGFQYSFDVCDEVEETDVIFSENPPALTDKESIMFLYGADIDLEDSGLNRLLKVVNPGAKMSCGCGTSFNFDPDLLDMYMGVK
jgi:iron-sulfur cluster assembly accessory protein